MPIGTVIYFPNETAGPPAFGVNAPAQLTADQQAAIDYVNFPQTAKNDIAALEDQFAHFTGGRLALSKVDEVAMMRQGINNAFDFGQYAFSKLSAADQTSMPWVKYGLDHTTFFNTTMAYADFIEQQTGVRPDQAAIDAALGATGTRGQINQQHWQDELQKKAQDPNSTFGWIKYGYSHQQFQDFKEQHARQYGKQLTDAEGTAALKEFQISQANPMKPGGEVSAQTKPFGQKSGDAANQQSAIR